MKDDNDGFHVYILKNIKNGKYYIGSTENFKIRLRTHFYNLKTNQHHSFILQKEYNFYGKACFQGSIVKTFPTRELALQYEQILIDDCDKLLRYNVSKYAKAGDQISYHPFRNKIVENMTKSLLLKNSKLSFEEKQDKWARFGKDNPNYKGREVDKICKCGNIKYIYSKQCDNCRLSNMYGENNSFYGKKHSDKTRKILSEKNKGKNHNPECMIAVIIEGIYYESITAAGKSIGISPSHVLFRLKSKNKRFVNYTYAEPK